MIAAVTTLTDPDDIIGSLARLSHVIGALANLVAALADLAEAHGHDVTSIFVRLGAQLDWEA